MAGSKLRLGKRCAVLAGAVVATSVSHSAWGSFTQGDLVVVQVGTSGSSTVLAKTGTATYLQEFSPGGGPSQLTLAMPTTASGTNQPLTIAGTAGSEGELSLSSNGQFLLIGGYDVGVGATTQTTSTIGLINAAGVIDTSTTTSLLSGNNTRGAASNNGTQLWLTGPKGLVSLTADTTSGGPTFPPAVNLDSLIVAPASVSPSGADALFGTSGKSPHGVIGFTPALPTAATTGTNLNGMSSALNPASFGFFFADPNTLFIADGSLGIQEWTGDGSGNWSDAATYNGSGGGFSGLTGIETGNTVQLYATTGSTSGWTQDNSLISLPFTFTSGNAGIGTFGNPAVLATATGDSAFAGVSFAPVAAVPEPAFIGMLVLGLGCLKRPRRSTNIL